MVKSMDFHLWKKTGSPQKLQQKQTHPKIEVGTSIYYHEDVEFTTILDYLKGVVTY
jgi:hypothetical protein